MCRLRIPNGILTHWQFAGLADLAEKLRRRLCARHHARQPADSRDSRRRTRVARDRGHRRISACARAARAPTISATSPARRPPASIRRSCSIPGPMRASGIYHILNDRSLYGLPRKFNVAFDGAGKIAVLEDTNDIGFQAVRGAGRLRGRARRLVPPRARRHHRPPGFRPRHRRHRASPQDATASPTPSCASSSSTATAPTATRRG